MAALAEQKPVKKKVKKVANTKATAGNIANNNNASNTNANTPKKKKKPKSVGDAGSVAGSSTGKPIQKRGRSATKRKVMKDGSLNGSLHSERPSSLSDMRSVSQDTVGSGQVPRKRLGAMKDGSLNGSVHGSVSATRRKVMKDGSLNGSLHSLGTMSSNRSVRSKGSLDSLSAKRPASLSDMRSVSQDTVGSGQERRKRLGTKRRSSTSGVESGKLSPVSRMDMAGRREMTQNLMRRHMSNPNLTRQSSNSSLISAGGRGGSQPRSFFTRQSSNSSLISAGGRGGSQPRSLRSVSGGSIGSLSGHGESAPSSFDQRRLNRLGARNSNNNNLKRAGSASGLSRQSSKSSICNSSDHGQGSIRETSNSRPRPSGTGDLQKLIANIESSNPEALARKQSPSRYQRWAERNRMISSRSLSESSGHTISSLGDDEFPKDETIWITGLRYIRILPPTPKECRSDRIIRYMIWGAMVLDFCAAMVSITTYESVTMCCGKPIFELLASQINWNEFIRVSTYLYLILIFVEIVPVFNKEIPLNLINPLIGFTITLAMFFDDRIGEAITMWIIEALAIGFETVISWLKRKQYLRHIARIEECDKELELRDGKRGRRGPAKNGVVEDDPYSDLESLSAGSFYNSKDAEINRFRIERERRQLMAGLKNEEINLRYHFVGSAINILLVLVTLILIIGIGKNGGLCISNFEAPPIFKDDQLDRCPACAGATGTCEVCDTTGGNAHQCYYPYLL